VKFPFKIDAMAKGNFVQKGDIPTDIALRSGNSVHLLQWVTGGEWQEKNVIDLPSPAAVSAEPLLFAVSHSSYSPLDNLLVNSGDNKLHILAAEPDSISETGQFSSSLLPFRTVMSLECTARPVAILPMRLNIDALNDLVILAENRSQPAVVLTEIQAVGSAVTTTADSGPGSMRQEMVNHGGPIFFNIPGPGPHIIHLLSPLPSSGGRHVIDGTSQPGFAGSPLIVIDGSAMGGGSALTLQADIEVVRGLSIVNSSTAISMRTFSDLGINTVEGNYIGVMPDGVTNAQNSIGISMGRGQGNTIGGTVPAARNVIVSALGVNLMGDNTFFSEGNEIIGNYVGTNAAGTAPILTFSSFGILTQSFGNDIGGTTAGAGNLVSGTNNGISGAERFTRIQGNFVGTDATGSYAIHNTIGVIVSNINSDEGSMVGGTTPAARNIIGGNISRGMILGQTRPCCVGGNRQGHIIQGNWIGVSASGQALPNVTGIEMLAANALVGGSVPQAANLIAYNYDSAIFGSNPTTTVAIIGNSIHSTSLNPASPGTSGAGLGIDLIPTAGTWGVTPNDLDDPDSGPNDMQNFPVLTSVTSTGGTTHITGSLNSGYIGGIAFIVEFFANSTCDPLGHGEGKTFLGRTQFGLGGTVHNADFDVTLPVSTPGGSFVTATATRGAEHPLFNQGNVTSEFSPCIQTTAGPRGNRITDFAGDGTSDLTLFRPADGFWFVRNATSGAIMPQQWGATGDIPQPADYDGDGRTDFAIFRPSTGEWWVLRSSDGSHIAVAFGISGDKPVAADYNGDGRADLAVYRPSTGHWYIFSLSDVAVTIYHWGAMEDKPVPQDFDGDGRADIAVFRPSLGNWYIFKSTTNTALIAHWGVSEDKPVAADYDGDGLADFAIWRPSTGAWWIYRSIDGTVLSATWGSAGDIPQPGDFNGDNHSDFIIWHPPDTSWYIMHSSDFSVVTSTFGVTTDTPASSPYRIE
jgi:hypothetical protein